METELIVSHVASHEVFCYSSQLKNRKKYREKNRLFDVGCNINLPGLQEDQPDHVRVESSSCCFPRELVSFVRPRELMSLDPRHVTRSPPIGKRI